MAKFLTLIVLLTCLQLTMAFAQDSIPEFGKITMEEMQMKECAFDKGADAMNLLNYESAEINTDFNANYVTIERRVRIKILRQTGVKHATIEIPYPLIPVLPAGV